MLCVRMMVVLRRFRDSVFHFQEHHTSVRRHVQAGQRSNSYLDDALQYGAGGIFGAKKNQEDPRSPISDPL